jgi:glucan phosphoethanolaminetransferase (alkaline phosphatase superfamily)
MRPSGWIHTNWQNGQNIWMYLHLRQNNIYPINKQILLLIVCWLIMLIIWSWGKLLFMKWCVCVCLAHECLFTYYMSCVRICLFNAHNRMSRDGLEHYTFTRSFRNQIKRKCSVLRSKGCSFAVITEALILLIFIVGSSRFIICWNC